MVDVSELKKYEVFNLFTEDQLKNLAAIADKKSYKANEHVYEHGDRAKALLMVTKGLVSLRELQPGDQVGIAFEMRESGELFGVASLMKPQQYTLTAVCLEDSEVLGIDADKLAKLCDADTQLACSLMTKVAQIYFDRYKTAKRQLHEIVKAPNIVITALPG